MAMHTQTKQIFLPFLIITFVMIPLYYSVLLPLGLEQYKADARCPNGTHKSPSGACEQVVPHEGLPRCPNGFHRSPSGICEAVNSGSNSETSNKNNNVVSGVPVETPAFNNHTSSSPGQCDQKLWNHVYNPGRLQMIDPCKTVSGTVESVRAEPDGDFHIRLKVDPQFGILVNSANVNAQYGDLVLEPICQNPVTQPDAVGPCANFHQNINMPPVGAHVTVTGSYVLDQDHGGWAEIHPVTSITP